MNVKIDSGNIKQLQKSLLEIQKLKTADFKKELLEQKKDIKEISGDSINLKNLDADTSTVNQNYQSIDFNLVFNFFVAIQVFVEGKIDREEKTLEICFKHNFRKEINCDGENVLKEFLFELKMRVAFEETNLPEENKYEREDILKFIERLVVEIFESFNNDINSLRALLINEKHFEKIIKSGKNQLTALVQTLLASVFSFIKHKEATGKSISFYPQINYQEPKEYLVKEVESFTVEIKQMDDEPQTKTEQHFSTPQNRINK